MTPEQNELIEQFQRELRCPIDWDRIIENHNQELKGDLISLWMAIAASKQVDDECRYLPHMYFYDENVGIFWDPTINIEAQAAHVDHPNTLRAELRNIRGGPDLKAMQLDRGNREGGRLETGWIESAREEYEHLVGQLSRLRMANDSDYRKHFLPASVSLERRKQLSLSGISYIHHEIEDQLAYFMWWSLMSDNWRKVFHEGKRFLYIQSRVPCGVTSGNETHFLKLDFDTSTPLVHAYPVLKEEIHAEETPIYCP